MPHALVNGEPEIGWVNYQILAARRDWFGRKFLLGFFGCLGCFLHQIAFGDVFVAATARRGETFAGGKPAALPVNHRDLEAWECAHAHSMQPTANARREEFLLLNEVQE